MDTQCIRKCCLLIFTNSCSSVQKCECSKVDTNFIFSFFVKFLTLSEKSCGYYEVILQ